MGRAWHIQDIRKDIDKGNQRTLWWFLNLPEIPDSNNAGSQPKVIRMVLSHVEQFHWSPRVHSLTCDLLSLQFPRWVHWLPSLRLVEGQIIHKAKRYLCSLFRECHNAGTLENHSYFHLQKEKKPFPTAETKHLQGNKAIPRTLPGRNSVKSAQEQSEVPAYER